MRKTKIKIAMIFLLISAEDVVKGTTLKLLAKRPWLRDSKFATFVTVRNTLVRLALTEAFMRHGFQWHQLE